MDTLVVSLLKSLAGADGGTAVERIILALVLVALGYLARRILQRGDADASKVNELLVQSVAAQVETKKTLDLLLGELHALRNELIEPRRRS